MHCTSILCSVSLVASSSFSKVIFNDALVSSTLTLPVNVFTWKKQKPCSRAMLARGTKIFVAPGELGLYIVFRVSATQATLLP